MAAHPVQLRVEDDLRRSRLTVFFRVLLAIPHFVWLALWSIATVFVGIANWFATLALGRPPRWAFNFLSSYVRYATQLNAYLSLAANPYPRFTADAAYPVRIELPAEPPPQARWKTLLRIVLAIPALLLSAALAGTPAVGYPTGKRRGGGGNGGASTGTGALAFTCSFLGWFASLVRGRMPKGLRDAILYGIGYGAQVLAYVLLLTDRYPNADPVAMLAEVEPPPRHPVELDRDEDLRRSRVTVFFRLPLAFPHLFWLVLWTVAAIVAGIVQWLATVARGTPIVSLHRFLSAYIRYTAHVYAFLYLVANPFPGFVGAPASYPVDVRLPMPERQHRVVTFFRGLLAVPALLVNGALESALLLGAVLMWFVGVFTARAPRGIRNLGVYAIRYQAQVNAYLAFVTAAYPHASPLDGRAPEEPELESVAVA